MEALLGGNMIFKILFLFLFLSGSLAVFDCDFTRGSLCEFKPAGDVNDNFKWQMYNPDSKASAANKYSDAKSLDDSFLYISPKDGHHTEDSVKSILMSKRTWVDPVDHCLTLKYRMFGPRVASLKIFLSPGFTEMDEVLKEDLSNNPEYHKLFDKTGSQGDSWHQVLTPWHGHTGLATELRWLVVEATTVANTQGEIALAEIHLTSGECVVPEGIDCSFGDSTCGWSNFQIEDSKPSSGWLLSEEGVTDLNGDHTSGTPFGHYAIATLDLATAPIDTVAPVRISDGIHHCVSFYYNLGDGALLNVGTSNDSQNEWMWLNRPTDIRNKWLRGEATIVNNQNEFTVVFSAWTFYDTKKSGGTHVAIDDVSSRQGQCDERGNIYFENGLGLYENTGDAQFDWIVTSSKTFGGVNLKDHTLDTKTGHFALAYFDGQKKGNKATLISPTFQPGEIYCLQFNYYFSSKNVASLNVQIGNKKVEAVASDSSLETSSYGVKWNFKTITLEQEKKDFQIVFEAIVDKEDSGFIALDDIIVTDTSCLDGEKIDVSSLTPVVPHHEPNAADCNFEDETLCKWMDMTDSDFNLEVAKSGRQMSHWDPGPDHSGNSDGIVVLTPSTEPLIGHGGIASPVLSGNSDGHCLFFWYYIQGRGVSMQVITTIVDQDEDTLIWQRPHDEGEGWQQVEVLINAEKDFQVQIVMQKSSEEGTAAVDDILYFPKSCTVKKINLVDICDFETGLCGLTKSSESDESWSLSTGISQEAKGGPSGDYTYKTVKGHYLLFDQSNLDPGSIAIQETPALKGGSDSFEKGQICVRFHYFMSGSDVGALKVTMNSEHKSYSRKAVWKAHGNHGDQWIPAEAQVDISEGSEVEVDFTAEAGSGPEGVIGLDDITFRKGKCSSPGSCNFHNHNTCGWRHDFQRQISAWSRHGMNFKDYWLEFRPGFVTGTVTDDMVSERFSGDQVRCIHFAYNHEAGDGVLYLKKVPVSKEEDEQLLWRMLHHNSNPFKKMRPARVSVDSTTDYEIRLSGEAHSSDYTIKIDNIMVTNQPCLPEPANAVSFDCDFTDGFCFWYQDLADDYDWVVKKGAPFVYLQPAFTKRQAVGRLLSPIIPAGEKCLKFSSLRFGADVGYLKVLMDIGHKRITYANWQGGIANRDWNKKTLDLTTDDNYQLVFEGMCKDGEECDIGITNIEISSSKCPDTWQSGSDNPHCTFEADSDPLCQWKVTSSEDLASFTWEREGGFDITDTKAPTMDYTFGAAGHYAYVSPPLTSNRTSEILKTALTSPLLHGRTDGPHCMTFAYYMKHSASGTLNIYQVAPGDEVADDQKPLWRAFVSDNKWRKGFATLEEMDTFQVIFEAVADMKTSEGLAIDEIFLHKGPCKEWKDKCDFAEDLCLWVNEFNGTDSFDWNRHRHEQSLDEGPLKDHTDPEGKGYFLVASSYFANKGENAKLLSPMHYPTGDTSNMCLQFFYFMSGEGSVVLDVNVLQGFESSKDPEISLNLWELQTSETKTKEWLKATVKLDEFLTERPFKLEFEVTMDDGSVAIDDIEILSKECKTTPDASVSIASVLAEASCSFDSGSMCGWENAQTDQTVPKWEVKEYESGSYIRRHGDTGKDSKYLFVKVEDEDVILKSPTFPPTDGIECLQFWYHCLSRRDESLILQMSSKGSKTVLWQAQSIFGWREISVNIHNDEPFQLYIQAHERGERHILEDIRLVPGVCHKDDCKFRYSFCGYTQDEKNDFDWLLDFSYESRQRGLHPDVQKHSKNEKGRIKSPIYAGGGPECLTFSYERPSEISGQLRFLAQGIGNEGQSSKLWEMPYLKTLHYYTTTKIHVPVFKTNPFRIVLEYEIEVANGPSPFVFDIKLLTHPCQPLGSCNFEEDFCSYQSKTWKRFSGKEETRSGVKNSFPNFDYTYGVPEGHFVAVSENSGDAAELVGPITPNISSSCLMFAYALAGSGSLEVLLDIDDAGRESLLKMTDSTEYHGVPLWKVLQADIQADEKFVVIFAAKSDDKGSQFAASLDNIKIVSGSCDEQTSSSISKISKAPEIIKEFSCNFEDASNEFCKFVLGKQNQGLWMRTKASLSTLGFDHTRKDSKGAFASLLSNSHVDVAEGELDMVAEISEKVPGCLSFWYHMSGHPFNTLRVFMTEGTPLWEKSNQQSTVWQHALVDLGISKQMDAEDLSSDEVDLFAFKFEGVLLENHGHVALDDIEIYTGSCPLTDICEFEDDGLCNFTQNNFETLHWTRTKAGDIVVARTQEQYIDHTYGTTEGHFMYCCVGENYITSASMISPMYKGSPQGRCLTFWLIKYSGSLIVSLVDIEGYKKELPSLYTSRSWGVHHLNIQSIADFQVVFRLYGSRGAAIDDVQVTPGPCHELYDCDFTRGFCTWTQKADGNAAWQISSGLPPAGQALVGPAFDHTTKSAAGQYIIIQGADESSEADVSTLYSETFSTRDIRALCFSFWYHMSNSEAGSLAVSVQGTSQTWGPFNHEEEGWLHEMMTVPTKTEAKGVQISLVATIEQGRQNYIAVDDIEVIGAPCVEGQHLKQFHCRDSAKTEIDYGKICDFVSDCGNDADEKECGSCSFEESWCRFVDVSTSAGWSRKESDQNATTGPGADANGFYLSTSESPYRTCELKTSNSFRMSSPSCKLQIAFYLSKDSTITVHIETHSEKVKIETLRHSGQWTTQDIFLGNHNVPFQISLQSWAYGEGNGIDDIKMIDCGFPSAQDKCLRDEFHCANKACIADYKVCDFQNDCGDFSDENECENFKREDFEYSAGAWFYERKINEGFWEKLKTPKDMLYVDHTPGSLAGYALQCRTYSSDAKYSCNLASPVLVATDESNSKSCQLRFFYWTEDDAKHQIAIYTRELDSTKLEKVSYTSVEEGRWNRVRATVLKDTDFQIIIRGTVEKAKEILGWWASPIKLALDDISLTDGCDLKTNVVTTTLPPGSDQGVIIPTDPVKEKKLTTLSLVEPVEVDTTTVATHLNPTPATDIKTPGTTHEKKKNPEITHEKKEKPEAPEGKGSSGKVTKGVPKENKDNWQLPVGLSFGFAAVVLIAVLVVIYLRRTNRLFNHNRRPFKHVNELYIQEDTQEMTETNSETNYGNHEAIPDMFGDTLPQKVGQSLDNPSYIEFDA